MPVKRIIPPALTELADALALAVGARLVMVTFMLAVPTPPKPSDTVNVSVAERVPSVGASHVVLRAVASPNIPPPLEDHA